MRHGPSLLGAQQRDREVVLLVAEERRRRCSEADRNSAERLAGDQRLLNFMKLRM
jgi:hypothetical protein